MTAGGEPVYDVVVAGGGPAGAAAATVAAQRGRRVLLLERAATPQFKVGESLMPATYWTLERLGVLERMKASAFPKKWSVQFFGPDGTPSAPFYFFETNPHESAQTWQVLRADFDQMLLDNAAAQGVEVRRGVTVREVLFEDGRAVGVRVADGGGPSTIACRVVVDATGQSTLLAGRLGLRRPEPRLRHASFFTHFAGARRDAGVDEGATLVLHTAGQRSWFWFIPLPDDRASVGVVGPLEHLVRGRSNDPERVFAEELAKCPALQPRLAAARQLMPMRATRDFSYRSTQGAGDGWVLVGDAFGFIDPIYSTGVFLALKSGEMAADAICDGLERGDLSAAQLGRFVPELGRGMEALRRLVFAFYDPEFSFAEFLRRYPHLRAVLIEMLVGNVLRVDVEPLLLALDEASLRTAGPAPREARS